MKKKKKNRPSPQELRFIGLDRNKFKRPQQWAVDQDYAEKLSPEDQEWLSKFNAEYYDGMGRHSDNDNPLHNTPELRRDCYNRNNRSNRDLYSILAQGKALVSEQGTEYDDQFELNGHERLDTARSDNSSEDTVIELIDSKAAIEKKISKEKASPRKKLKK